MFEAAPSYEAKSKFQEMRFRMNEIASREYKRKQFIEETGEYEDGDRMPYGEALHAAFESVTEAMQYSMTKLVESDYADANQISEERLEELKSAIDCLKDLLP